MIRQDKIEAFDAQMLEFRDELDEAVLELDRHYGELTACWSTGRAATSSAARNEEVAMQIVIHGDGQVRCLYDEAIDLTALGPLDIRRGSHVEPDEQGQWLADLAPVRGPVLGPFQRRSDALDAEAAWIEANWLTAADH